MNRTKRLAIKIGFVLCGALLGYTTHGQPSVEVGVTVPLPSVEVVAPSVEIHAESDFYEPLAPYGEWVVVGSYGRCWRPRHVDRDWRPYCNGNWQRTDVGWYWASDESWAWATYHYGRWDFTDQYGWYWVPQTQWAPAWVSWHEGGGYVGWAPLQPGVTISAGGYVGFNESRIPPRAFVFVEQRRFLEPIRPTTIIVNNTTIINKTVVMANTTVVNNRVINEGPATAVIEKASGQKIQPVPVQELRHKEEAAVAATPRTPVSAGEKKIPTPVRSEAAIPEKKTVAAHEPPQIEKPAAATHEPATPAPKNIEPQSEPRKPALAVEKTVAAHEPPQIEKPAAATHEPATPAPKNIEPPSEPRKPALAIEESRPVVKSQTVPESRPPAAIKEPTWQNAHQQPAKQERSAQPSNNGGQPPAREKPVTSEKSDPNAGDKNHENKPKE